MSASVQMDTSALEAAMRRFGDGIGDGSARVGMTEAERTATLIRGRVPRRTGRLAATVRAVPAPGGGAVEYGGGLPYAAYIERRSHAVASGLSGAAERFTRAQTTMIEREIGQL